MDPLLETKTILVTGAATGIGAAVARLFRQEGATVVAFGLGGLLLDRLAAETGVIAVHGSVTEDADLARAVGRVDGLDGLVHAAGVVAEDEPLSVADEVWDRTIAVNLTGTMRTNRAVLPALLSRGGGAIVNIASVAAFNASPGMATYAASKSGIVSFTRSIAVTYGPRGIRANCLCPGWTRTPMSEAEMESAARAAGSTREAEEARLAGQLALRRLAGPEEIARCALFLASDMASFVTGAVLVADGGGRVPAGLRAV
jgi:NAD(P)-dependent dehydrogenase (short-subunit alcohol dehydrogenase family)